MQTFKLADMISRQCYERIFKSEVVSNEIVGVVGCMNDRIQIQFLDIVIHKEKVGLIIVSADVVSVLVIFYFFRQLKKINREYLDILDRNVINIQDFSFEIKNLDTTLNLQDFRSIKMKLWIHLSDLLSHLHTKDGEPQQIVDIQLSVSKQPKHMIIYKMNEI